MIPHSPMFPVVFYYGGDFFEMPTSLSLPCLGTEMSFMPYATPFQMAYPSTLLSCNNDERAAGFKKCVQEQHNKDKSQLIRKTSIEVQEVEERQVKRIQNPLRNIFTNITNLVLNFIVCKKKVGGLLEKIDPSMVGDKLLRFYKYVKDMKTYFCSYFNLQKVKRLFAGTSLPIYNHEFHRLFRIACRYIIQEKIPACLLTSKKLSPMLKVEHFQSKRAMLALLKQSPDCATIQ